MDLRARGGEDLPTSTRRSRGGQPGNTNAVKSGFYSRQVSPSNESHYREALNVEGLHEEIALLRVLIAHQIEEGADTGEISKGMEILVRAVSAQYRHEPEGEGQSDQRHQRRAGAARRADGPGAMSADARLQQAIRKLRQSPGPPKLEIRALLCLSLCAAIIFLNLTSRPVACELTTAFIATIMFYFPRTPGSQTTPA